MTITQPSRLTFWRLVFAVSAFLPFLSILQLLNMASSLGVDISASSSWMRAILSLSVMCVLPLLFWTLTGSRYQERILSLAEFPERLPDSARWIAGLLLLVSVTGFTLFLKLTFLSFLVWVGWFRVLVFWYFSLIGLFALKSIRRDIPWLTTLLSVAICQSVFHLLLAYWTRVTDYPFAMGWSETSRFYYPSLFLSEIVYGREYPWPILHPTLHLLLAPPYLFDTPLWVHRFWQVAIRYILVAAIVPVLMRRLSIQSLATRWIVGLWMFLFLFMGPIYFHLTIPVILLLWGFSQQDDRRTWIAVILASIWCGWSRVNWYPMPGMMAAVLYLMEVPIKGKNVWQYLLKPALWFVTGTLIAFASQRVYIALSGVPDSSHFYTSFTSNLLWYRLMPNASYFLGILPASILASLPLWLGMYLVISSRKGDWHPIRLTLIFAALFVLFVGGLVVSVKIGGGANLHNMDAYLIMLLIVFAYFVFARYRRENGELAQPVAIPWLLALSLIIMPAWSYLQFGIDFKSYDHVRTEKIMAKLQQKVDEVNAEGGEVLFITQRHLIAMNMLENVTLVPEYEREDLMEMVMADNLGYLARFRDDIGNQRFALIVVDPLNDTIMRRTRSFSEENNAWVRRVVVPILCNYREEAAYPLHEIALYVPQKGERQCP
jgi:hypothetical protein